MFEIDEDTKAMNVLHTMSFTSSDPGMIKSALKGTRSDLSDVMLNEMSDLVPYGSAYGDMNDDDDTPSF